MWEGARGLAEDVSYYGQWMRDRAFERIGDLYPKVKLTEWERGYRYCVALGENGAMSESSLLGTNAVGPIVCSIH